MNSTDQWIVEREREAHYFVWVMAAMTVPFTAFVVVTLIRLSVFF